MKVFQLALIFICNGFLSDTVIKAGII